MRKIVIVFFSAIIYFFRCFELLFHEIDIIAGYRVIIVIQWFYVTIKIFVRHEHIIA